MLQAQLRRVLVPGITKSNPFTEALSRVGTQPLGAPQLFWACPVGLTDPLPAQVTGEELLFTSPLSLVEDPPPQNTQPVNFFGTALMQNEEYTRFFTSKQDRLRTTPRAQVPVMAMVNGEFTSAFVGKEIPRSFDAVDPVQVIEDPLDGPIKDDPLADPDRADEEEANVDANADADDPQGPPPAGQQDSPSRVARREMML